MKCLKVLFFAVMLMAGLAWSSPVWAATGINQKINFQGKVVNKGIGSTDGTNVVDGNYDFVFTVWDALSVGNSLWVETWNSGTTQVSVTSGIFNVALGTYTSMPGNIDFNTDNIYLSVNFDGDGDMSPRIQFTAVPYAMNARTVGGAIVTGLGSTLALPTGKTVTFGDSFISSVGVSLDQNLSKVSTVIFGGLTSNGGVGISGNLAIGGSVTMTGIPVGVGNTVLYIGSDGKLVQGTLPPGGAASATNGLSLISSAVGLGGTLTENTSIGTSSFGLSFLGLGNSQSLYIGSNGMIGIGNTTPTYKLDVTGDINLSGTIRAVGVTGASGQVLSSNGSGGMSWITPGGATYYANNGLTMTGTTVGLGGTLTQNTNIGVSSFGLTFSNGATILNLNSNGNVGIGTTNPIYLLNVNGEVVATKFGIGGTSSTFSIYVNAGGIGVSGDSNFAANLNIGGSVTMTGIPVGVGNTVLYIGSDGKLVQGTLPPGGAASATNGLSLISGSVGLGGTLMQNTSIGTSSFSFSFLGLGNTQVFYISNTGTIGIGTTGMGHQFDIVGRGSTGYVAGIYNDNTAPTAGGLYINSDGFGSILGVGIGATDVMLISALQSLFNNPANFTSSGDVGIAYDLYLTNQTSNNIKSYGPLVIESGELYESLDLTLRTNNAGNIVLDVGPSGQVMVSTGTGKTTPVLFVLDNGSTDPAGTNGAMYYSLATNAFRCYTNGSWGACGGSSYSGSNGININGTTIGLGGTLMQNTSIGTSSFGLSFLGLGNSQSLYIGSNGMIGIGKTNPIYKLDVTGDINLTGTILAVGVTGSSGQVLSSNGSGGLSWFNAVSVGSTYASKIILSPEYPGGSLTKDGSTTFDGSMTSDNNLNAGTSGWRNYYEWSSTNAALQDYSVLVRVTLPGDFDSWETGACPGSTCAMEVNYQTGVGSTLSNYISFQVNSDSENQATAICTVAGVGSTVWASTGCTDAILNDGSAPEWDAAGETAIIRIKMAANNTASALSRVGDIILRYKAR